MDDEKPELQATYDAACRAFFAAGNALNDAKANYQKAKKECDRLEKKLGL